MTNEPPKIRITLIRHGETDWNRDGRWQGQADIPLSPAGRAQAETLAGRLAGELVRYDALYASDLRRAAETAAIIGRAIRLQPSLTPALREIDLGRWSGHTRAEIAQFFPEDWRRLEADEDIARGGGETFAGFQRRLLAWLADTSLRQEGKSVCAVTHGGCIRAILLHAQGLGWAERRLIPPIENGAVAMLTGSRGRWAIAEIREGVQGSGPDSNRPPASVDEGEII